MGNLSIQRLLGADALTCAAMGALLLAAAGPVGSLTLLPQDLLRAAGGLLMPIAAFMAVFARARRVPRWASAVVVAGNAGWVVASVALLAVLAPNGLGVAFLLAQAGAVALLAWLEFRAAGRGAAPEAS